MFNELENVLRDIAFMETNPSPQETMRYQLLRLCTLRNYPRDDKPSIIRLAQAGFYYAAESDEVVCYVCCLRKRGWCQSDMPMDVHRQITPSCRFLTHNGDVNVPVPNSSDSERTAFEFHDDVNAEHVAYGNGATNHSPSVNSTASGGTYTNTSAPSPHFPEIASGISFEIPKFPRYSLRSARLSDDINNILGSVAAQSVLENGYTTELITKAIERVLIRFSVNDITASIIMAEVQELEDEEQSSKMEREKQQITQFQEQIEQLRSEKLCKVCLDKNSCIAVLPCGHLAVCEDCSNSLKHCPICRSYIQNRMKIYIS